MTNRTDNALPDDFQPGVHDVVIFQGAKFNSHAGNVWLRSLVAVRIQEYSSAPKGDKSLIISSLMDCVRAHGRFVKQDAAGKWWCAKDLTCREKCSQAFRNQLGETYRSSSASKMIKRRVQVQVQGQRRLIKLDEVVAQENWEAAKEQRKKQLKRLRHPPKDRVTSQLSRRLRQARLNPAAATERAAVQAGMSNAGSDCGSVASVGGTSVGSGATGSVASHEISTGAAQFLESLQGDPKPKEAAVVAAPHPRPSHHWMPPPEFFLHMPPPRHIPCYPRNARPQNTKEEEQGKLDEVIDWKFAKAQRKKQLKRLCDPPKDSVTSCYNGTTIHAPPDPDGRRLDEHYDY